MADKPITTIGEYKLQKSRVNAYERILRKKNPRKHAIESKKFVSAVIENAKGKGKKKGKK